MPECRQCGRQFGSSVVSSDICPDCAAAIRSDSILPAPSGGAGNQPRRLQWRIPWLTLLLASLIVVTYFLQVSADHSRPKHAFDPVLLALCMKGQSIFAGQWWRLLTAIFVHIDLYHLLSNLCFLLLFGSIAETVFQRGSYLTLWFLAGIAGSVSQLAVLSPRGYGYGASGVAFGLVGALWSAYSSERVAFPARRWSVALLLGIFIILGFVPDWIHSHYINAAHLGGLLAGMILGIVLPTRTSPAPARRLWAIVAIAAIVFAGCAKLARARQDFLLQLFAIEDAHPDWQQLPALSDTSKLQGAVARHPELAIAHLLLARAYLQEKRFDDAIHEYSFVLAARPQQADLWNEAGHALLGAHRYPEASVAFLHYIELLSLNANTAGHSGNAAEILQGLASLAQAYELGGQIDQAIEVNRHILRTDPQNLEAKNNLDRLLNLAAPASPHPQPATVPESSK